MFGLDAIGCKSDSQYELFNRTIQFIRVVRQVARRFSSDIKVASINLRDRPKRDAIAKNNSLLYTRNSFFCKVIQDPIC
jgi:hypothetical protein